MVAANFTSPMMLRNVMVVLRTDVSALDVGRRPRDSFGEIGTQFSRRGNIKGRLFLIYAHQERGKRIEECIRPGLSLPATFRSRPWAHRRASGPFPVITGARFLLVNLRFCSENSSFRGQTSLAYALAHFDFECAAGASRQNPYRSLDGYLRPRAGSANRRRNSAAKEPNSRFP